MGIIRLLTLVHCFPLEWEHPLLRENDSTNRKRLQKTMPWNYYYANHDIHFLNFPDIVARRGRPVRPFKHQSSSSPPSPACCLMYNWKGHHKAYPNLIHSNPPLLDTCLCLSVTGLLLLLLLAALSLFASVPRQTTRSQMVCCSFMAILPDDGKLHFSPLAFWNVVVPVRGPCCHLQPVQCAQNMCGMTFRKMLMDILDS